MSPSKLSCLHFVSTDIQNYINLYEDISIIDSDSEETKEVEISGLAAQYNIKIDDKYLSGLEHGFDLDKRYDNFDELPKEYLEKMNLLITEQLDTYTNLKTI